MPDYGQAVLGSASQEFSFEAVRGLWPNLTEGDKQQMPKSRGGSSTCGAASANIYCSDQINTHALRSRLAGAGFGGAFIYLQIGGKDEKAKQGNDLGGA
jgi:hypothetical protein